LSRHHHILFPSLFLLFFFPSFSRPWSTATQNLHHPSPPPSIIIINIIIILITIIIIIIILTCPLPDNTTQTS
jgi:hypothetical protein